MYTKIKPFAILNNIDFLSGEEWRTIFDPEYDIKPYYYISNYGRVYSTSRNNGQLRTLVLDEHGYYRVQLCLNDGSGRYFPVHRLVLYTFGYIDGCEQLQVNHKDTIKTNNHISNLEWCTCKENIRHAVEAGVFGALACNNSNSTTTDEQVDMVCRLWIKGKTCVEISTITGVSQSNIYNIIYGSTRKNISSKYNLKRRLSHPLSIQQMHKICEYFQNTIQKYTKKTDMVEDALNYSGAEITNKTISAAFHLLNRNTHINITSNYNY